MARLPPSDFFTPGRGRRHPGKVYTFRRGDQQFVAHTPRRLAGPYTAEEVARQKLFKGASVNVAYMSAGQQVTARLLAERSVYAVRDYLTKCLFARQFRFQRKDGKVYFAVVARNDVSMLLDPLGQTEGDVLFRGKDWWYSVPLGPPGTFLGVSPTTGEPGYFFPGGGGGGAGMALLSPNPDAFNDTSNYCFKGLCWRPEIDQQVTGIWYYGRIDAGWQMRALLGKVASFTSSTPLTYVNVGPVTVLAANISNQWQYLPLSSPVDLLAGEQIVMGAGVINGTGTFPLPINGLGSGTYRLPLIGKPDGVWGIANVAPAIGTTVDQFAALGAIGLGYVTAPN